MHVWNLASKVTVHLLLFNPSDRCACWPDDRSNRNKELSILLYNNPLYPLSFKLGSQLEHLHNGQSKWSLVSVFFSADKFRPYALLFSFDIYILKFLLLSTWCHYLWMCMRTSFFNWFLLLFSISIASNVGTCTKMIASYFILKEWRNEIDSCAYVNITLLIVCIITSFTSQYVWN